MSENERESEPVLLKPSDFRAMPWKNGEGTTAEIALEPATGADFENGQLLWRLSSAPILRDGDFSSFAGYDRFLTLTEGKSLSLHTAGRLHKLRRGDIHHFSGDDPTRAEIPEGPVKDLGLIYRRGRVQAELNFLDFPKARSFSLRSRTTFFFLVSGQLLATAYPGGKEMKLEAGSALRSDAPKSGQERLILLEPKAAACEAVSIELLW